MDGVIVLSAGGLTMLLLEGIKWLIKKRTNNPDFNFSPLVFAVGVPVLNALMPFILVYGLGYTVSDPILTFTAVGVVRYVISTAISSLISFFGYDGAIKPLKAYNARVKALKLDEN